jgi:transcriptional regulator with XRE-family HTH domain
MDYPKLPAAEVVLRREKLGLSVKGICRAVRVSEATWKRWERVDSAPAFVHFLLAYLEARPGADVPKAAPRAPGDDEARFREKVAAGEGGCLLWTAGGRFKLRGENVRPRKAAWFFARGEVPDRDVLTTCGNADCVAAEHLHLGKQTGRHRGIEAGVKSAILLELRQGKSGADLARKYRVSPGTISALKKLVQRTEDK